MEQIISKELLSEVLNYKQTLKWEDCEYTIKDTTIILNCVSKVYGAWVEYINIHELAHLCKEFAATKGIAIDSGTMVLNNKITEYHCSVYTDNTGHSSAYFEAETEPDAVFQATQWILDNRT